MHDLKQLIWLLSTPILEVTRRNGIDTLSVYFSVSGFMHMVTAHKRETLVCFKIL